MEINFVINGDPIPWARPGQSRYGRYDTQRAYKDSIGCILNTQWRNHKPLEGFILLRSIFYVPIPMSYSKKKQEELDGTPSKKKPDEDNLSKLYRDILTEVGVWKDDSQVCASMSAKIYSTHPMILITIKEIDDKKFGEFLELF